MALNTVPSLQSLTEVKVALAVFNDDIIHFLDEFIKLGDIFTYSDSFRISKSQKERIKEIEMKLFTYLPESPVNRVIFIFRPIVGEVHFWVRDHYHIIKHIEKRHIMNNLCWKREVTIDRTKTSKQLIQNESINKRVRFALAAMYFYERDILQLWESMTTKERNNISLIDSDLVVRMWTKGLRENAASPWTQWMPEYLSFAHQELITSGRLSSSGRIRIRSFYSVLNKYDKRRFIHSLWPYYAHTHDLLECYYLSDETERDEIFHNPDHFRFQSKTKKLLGFYIDWPLQRLFLDVVNQMWDRLTPECFEHCLFYIVQQKLSESVEDFDYLKLFKDLWNLIPESYKKRFGIRTRKFAPQVLRYDKKAKTVSFEEILEGYKNISAMQCAFTHML
ncbi:uncharacterized protein LOC129981510 [Argiope bruennichi]|uniref:uncharacterized protein LOC129981510 n=1 Tax=Argiope bruennichi TaxID=94029 RepID=UPI002493DC45|nr:uncharacterized protein LOC129981510 [Argiope bruennichi]